MSEHKGRPPEHEEHEEHLDEKWLVSYADMMTLLFGLFVMLFSIASENQGQFQEQLKKISDSSFNSTETPQAAQPTPTPTPPPEDQTKKELEALKVESETLKKSLEEQVARQMELDRQIEDKKKNEDELARKIASLEKEREDLRKTVKDAKVVAKATPTPTPAPKKDENLKAEIDKLKNELSLEKKKTVDQADAQKLKERLEKELQLTRQQLEKEKTERMQQQRQVASVQQDQNKVKELEQANKDLQEKQTNLEKSIEEMKNEAKKQAQFMIVILKWSSEKHDLDLTVTDPSGHVFNFKNRKFAGSPGEFTLDSRSGPGAEIWQSDKIVPGVYNVTWKLYNTYGNDKPVTYSGFISSNRSRVGIPESTFEAKVGQQRTIRIEADAKGNLKQLP
ncbi:MAG: hypothetical protein KF681_17180 [Bdellovibrionaceae bacterium]|nr:hypothetical protein [Pseudobdellovibrionaceae bacterium]